MTQYMLCTSEAVFQETVNNNPICLCLDHTLQLKSEIYLVLQNKKPIRITIQKSYNYQGICYGCHRKRELVKPLNIDRCSMLICLYCANYIKKHKESTIKAFNEIRELWKSTQ